MVDIRKTECCDEVVSDDRDDEMKQLDALQGREVKEDYGIYTCPKCGKDSSTNVEYL